MLPPRHRKIIAILKKLYPEPRSELVFNNPYELLVSVLLSAQCTDKKVNEVTPILFKNYPGFERLRDARLSKLQKIIRPINYYRTKSKNLLNTAKMIAANFGGKLPLSHAELLTLPGVGNKTANVVLSEMEVAHTFPVDTHVFRVSKRLGFANGKNAFEVEKDLKELFPSKLWRPLHHWLIFHGRRVCKARPLCPKCALAKLCPARKVYYPDL